MRLRLRAAASGALLIHPKGEPDHRAVEFARCLAPDDRHTLVVVDLPAEAVEREWQAVARLLAPARYRSLRLVFGRGPREEIRRAGARIAERLGREVVAADGEPTPTISGGLFVPADRGEGWLRFTPGRPAERDSQRFPKPAWEFTSPTGPRPLGPDTVAEPLPSGVWVRSTREEPPAAHRRQLVEAVPADLDLLLVVIGSPGAPAVALDAVARFWGTVLPSVRPAVRFVLHGTLETPGTAEPGQALADALGHRVVRYPALPVAVPGAGEPGAARTFGAPGYGQDRRAVVHLPAQAQAQSQVQPQSKAPVQVQPAIQVQEQARPVVAGGVRPSADVGAVAVAAAVAGAATPRPVAVRPPDPPGPTTAEPAPVASVPRGPVPPGPLVPEPTVPEPTAVGPVEPSPDAPAPGTPAPASAPVPRFRLESGGPPPPPAPETVPDPAPSPSPSPAAPAVPGTPAASAAAPASAGLRARVQPVPEAAACAVPPERGIEQERGWVRRTFSEQFNAIAGSVSRVMSESPGLRGTDRAEAAAALTELVSVRLYLSGDSRRADAAVRSADPGPHVPLARCVAAGLRRLPSYRGPALLRSGLGEAERGLYREGGLLTEWAFCHARTTLHAGPPGGTDVLVWSMTARRTAMLDPAAPDRVLFLPGTGFKVLRVDGRTVMLRELSPSEIAADGRVDLRPVKLDAMALAGLERIPAALAAAGTDETLEGADAPGLMPVPPASGSRPPGTRVPGPSPSGPRTPTPRTEGTGL
ncbi:hypothetical protein ACFYUY_08805 [Kitasatospora sp. NPDC004745]|uniref:hypothetical protein n=1 Tax=Kitasatospora sp. NPDC004745 TaxID=3364019 RepID=UPI003683A1F5